MNKIFVIKDTSDNRKALSGLYKDRVKAEQRLAALRAKVSQVNRDMIYCSEVAVQDFTPNATKVYIVYNKSDAQNKENNGIVGFYFDPFKAGKKVQEIRQKLPSHAQKLVFTKIENIE